MNKSLLVAPAIIFACLVIGGLLTCDSTPHFITEEQAKSRVRSFENDSNLQLNCEKGLQSDVGGAEWRHRYYYEIGKLGSDGVNIWSVNAISGEVDMMMNSSSNSSYDEPGKTSLKLQARTIAEAFAKAKYSGFNTTDYQFYSDKWIRDGWSFLWVRYTAYNAMTVNKIEVNVRPDMTIGMYDATRYPLPDIQSPPAVSAIQAIEAAAEAVEISTVTWNSTPELTATPAGYFYDFQICGTTMSSAIKDVFVQVNGDTGDVLSIRYH